MPRSLKIINSRGLFRMTHVSLTDLVELKDLQRLQDSFAKSNHVASTIVDINGIPITTPSNHTKVCSLIRKTKTGSHNCMLSGELLGKNALSQNVPYYHHCLGIGFIDAAAPIVIEDKHIANWLIGQTCIGNVDEKRILAYAEEIGTDKEELLEAFLSMNVVSEEDFKEKLDFLWVMASQISTLAYQNLRYKNIVNNLKTSERQLKNYKEKLETLVDQRTTELQIALDEVRTASMKDGLTGCYNRAFIEENLPRELTRGQRYDNPVSILLCDLDHFKAINDMHGHQVGDLVLREVVRCIETNIRKDIDWVARYGGEEFLIVMPLATAEFAKKTADRLRCQVASLAIETQKETLSVTASFGVSSIDSWQRYSGITIEDFLRTTDQNLYQAKHQGRNCCVASLPQFTTGSRN